MDYEMECGCEYIDHGFDASSTGINLCQLHRAAPDLLEAAFFLREVMACPEGETEWKAFYQMSDAINKATNHD